MSTIQLNTLAGSPVKLDREEIGGRLTGNLIYPDSEGYDAARAIWNAMIDRRPGLIVSARGEADVVAAVDFAREKSLALAVKGAGHNIAGKAMVDGGIVIDLSGMKDVIVDADKNTASVQPGATLGDVDKATQAEGLLVPTGINSTTGISGLTLGGGFGWATRKHGLTIDNLHSARVVTAAGEALRADEGTHADLFWAIRGGGGNFGVVTEFEFDLHAAGPEVLAGMVVHPFADFAGVVTEYQAALEETDDDVACWLVLRRAPPLPFLPEQWHGKEICVLALCCFGPSDEAESAAAPLRSIGNPIADVVGTMPYLGWQTALDPLLTPGARNYWKTHDVASLKDDIVAVLERAASSLPTDECEVFIAHLGGQMARVPSDATAWPNRSPHFVVNMHARWRDPADDDRCRSWARDVHDGLAPHAMGSMYVNFISDGDNAMVENAYGGNLEHLQRVKREYDPGNLFRANQNVTPAA